LNAFVRSTSISKGSFDKNGGKEGAQKPGGKGKKKREDLLPNPDSNDGVVAGLNRKRGLLQRSKSNENTGKVREMEDSCQVLRGGFAFSFEHQEVAERYQVFRMKKRIVQG